MCPAEPAHQPCPPDNAGGPMATERARLGAAGLGAEEFLVFALNPSPFVGVLGRRLLAGNVRPGRRVFAIELKPLLSHRLAVGNDRFDRALGLAYPAIDALVGMDDEHVLALVKAIDRAHLDAIH